MSESVAPRPPAAEFNEWPAHLVLRPYGLHDEQAIYLWYGIERPFAFVHAQTDLVDLVASRAIVYAVDRIVDLLRNAETSSGPMSFIDFSEPDEFTLEARRYQTAKVRSNLADFHIEKSFVTVRMSSIGHLSTAVLAGILTFITGASLVPVRDREGLLAHFTGHALAPDPAPPHLEELRALADAVDYAAVDPN